MRYILNSTELLFHIPKRGIPLNKLENVIIETRHLSRDEAYKSIERALSLKTVIRLGDILKPSPNIKFIR